MLTDETWRQLERAILALAELERLDPVEAAIARGEIREVLEEWRAGEQDQRVADELRLIGDVLLERHPTLPAPPPPAVLEQGA